METIQIVKENKITTKKDLVVMQIKRTVDGTRLFVKSPIFENFFKEYGDRGDAFTDADGKTRQMYGKPELRGAFSISSSFDKLVTNEGYANLTFLRAVGIGEGIQFKISGLQSNEAIEAFYKEFKDATLELHRNTMKPITKFLRITISEDDKIA